MMALQAQRLASAGIAAVIPDLFGTGDSDGDFGDATWAIWQSDLAAANEWTRHRFQAEPWLLALRSGVLLAASVQSDLQSDAIRRCIAWAPVYSGRTFLTQFMRVETAAAAISGAPSRVSTKALWDRANSGQAIEIAGYEISSDLALPLAALELESLVAAGTTAFDLIEVLPTTDAQPSVAARKIAGARAGSPRTRLHVVTGDPFWATTEVTLVPELLERSTQLVLEHVGS